MKNTFKDPKLGLLLFAYSIQRVFFSQALILLLGANLIYSSAEKMFMLILQVVYITGILLYFFLCCYFLHFLSCLVLPNSSSLIKHSSSRDCVCNEGFSHEMRQVSHQLRIKSLFWYTLIHKIITQRLSLFASEHKFVIRVIKHTLWLVSPSTKYILYIEHLHCYTYMLFVNIALLLISCP